MSCFFDASKLKEHLYYFKVNAAIVKFTVFYSGMKWMSPLNLGIIILLKFSLIFIIIFYLLRMECIDHIVDIYYNSDANIKLPAKFLMTVFTEVSCQVQPSLSKQML
jgi:hypothetical protein